MQPKSRKRTRICFHIPGFPSESMKVGPPIAGFSFNSSSRKVGGRGGAPDSALLLAASFPNNAGLSIASSSRNDFSLLAGESGSCAPGVRAVRLTKRSEPGGRRCTKRRHEVRRILVDDVEANESIGRRRGPQQRKTFVQCNCRLQRNIF